MCCSAACSKQASFPGLCTQTACALFSLLVKPQLPLGAFLEEFTNVLLQNTEPFYFNQ